MSDDVEKIKSLLKKFLSDELKEIRENKIRFAALVVSLGAVLFFSFGNFFTDEEEISMNNSETLTREVESDDENSSEQKISTVSGEENIIPVLGANSDALFVRDPFKVVQKNKSPSKKIFPPPLPQTFSPAANIQSGEKIILVGTAIGENKTALLRKSSGENLILGIGDNLQGKIIADITADFLQFNDGSRLYINSN